MWTVETDENKLKRFFKENGIEKNGNSGCVTAKTGGQILGFCLYDLDGEKIVIKYICPLDDIPLSDGILRSTLHVAAERFVMNAFYADTVPEDFLKKIGFIKNADEKRLDIDKLFKSCSDCNR